MRHLRDMPFMRVNIEGFLDRERHFFTSTLSLNTSVHQTSFKQATVRWDQNSILCFICAKAAIYGSSLFFLSPRKEILDDDVDKRLADQQLKDLHAGDKKAADYAEKYKSAYQYKILHKLYDYRRYFVIFDGTNDYSLGRIIRRLHVLSELRCLAFVERSRVVSLHNALRKLGSSLSDVFNDMTNMTSPKLNVNALNI